MTTAKSSFNMARFLPVYKNLLRRNRGSALFYGVLGFLFFSLQYLLSYLEYLRYPYPENALRTFELIGPANVYNGFAVVFFTGMSLIVPVVMATNLFGYMQNKRSVDVYHALPLTRSELYLATSAAGITLIWAPMLLNFLLVAGCALLVGGQSIGMIFLELLCWMVITFVIFALTAFAAVNVGTTFDTAIFSMGLNASLAAVYMTVIAIGSAFLYGFYEIDNGMLVAYRLSPVALMIGRQTLGRGVNAAKMLQENNIAIALWFIAGIVVFVIGMFVYKRRRSEQAESVGNLGPLQLFMRSVGTLVGGAVLGAIFCGVFGFETSKAVFLASVAVGALITYFIGDVMLTRTVRSIPRALPTALATTLGVCLLVGGVMYGGFGYEKRVPGAESVASVALDSYSTRYANEPSLYEDYSRTYSFSDPESIALIISAHQAQVQAHDANKAALDIEDSFDGSLRVTYTLKNGKTLSRRYYGLYNGTREALLALESQPELIRQSHAAFKGTADMLSSVTVVNALGNDSKTLSLTAEQKQQLLEAVRADLLSQPADEFENGAQALGYVQMEYRHMRRKGERTVTHYANGVAIAEEMTTDEQNYSVSTSEVLITESLKNTRALLEQLGAGEQLQNDFSKVEKAYIGVMGYHLRSWDSVVTQSSADKLYELNDVILHAYYDKEYYNQEGEPSRVFVAIDPAQLTAMRKDLTSIYTPQTDKPYVVVGISGIENGNERITGYYYMPLEALSEQMKYKVCESALNEYDRDYLIRLGYNYF